MALKQYIGARYVTKIYENSLDPLSAEWEADVNYEPLTMVTFNYGSYLSKKDVPATVGNPSDNPDYWVQTGFYNGQIAYLYDQVSNINNALGVINGDLEDLNDLIIARTTKKYIFIGDSYGHASDTNNGWIDKLVTMMGLTSADYFESAVGGAGFGTVSNNFLTLITGVVSSMTAAQKASITDVVVLGGANDRGHDVPDMATYINAFMSYVNTNLPNANVHIGMCAGNYADNFIGIQSGRVLDGYLAGSGYSYITNVEYVFHDRTLIGSDHIHPTDDGYERLANFVHAYLTGRSFSVGMRERPIATITDGTMTGSIRPFIVVENNLTTFNWNYIIAEFDTAKDIERGLTVDIDININSTIFLGETNRSASDYNLASIDIPMAMYSAISSDWISVHAQVEIYNGELWISNLDGALTAADNVNLRQVKKIYIPVIQFSLPSIYC